MKQQLRFFYQQSKGFRRPLIYSLLLGLLTIVCGLLFVYISKRIVDVATGRAQGNLWQHVAFLVFLLVWRLVTTGARAWIAGRVQQRMVNTLRARFFRIVLNSPWHGREDLKSGDIMSRINDDLRLTVDCIVASLPSVVLSLFQLIAASWFLFSLQPHLLYIMVLIMPIAIVFSKIYYRTMRRLTKQIRAEEADIHSHIQESVQNRPLLLSLHRTSLMSHRLDQRQSQLFSTFTQRLHFSIRTRLFINAGFNLGYYTAFVWAAYGLMQGTVTYGMMTALLQLVGQVQAPILDLSNLFPSIVQACASAERLQEIQGADPAASQPADAYAQSQANTTTDALLGIRLSDLSYRYPDGDADVLHHFSATFAAGSSTAIIGPTGSGKSTLVRLLLGLLQPTSGQIQMIDAQGNPCRGSVNDIAYVPQGNSLLSGTIRDNLLLGRLDATEADMRDALTRASATFVFSLPQGLDAPCGEKGSGLSEGQAQRIAIARALLQPGSILIMDEASSALDPETEQQILSEISQQQLGKTLIWVTHHMAVRDYLQHCVVVD